MSRLPFRAVEGTSFVYGPWSPHPVTDLDLYTLLSREGRRIWLRRPIRTFYLLAQLRSRQINYHTVCKVGDLRFRQNLSGVHLLWRGPGMGVGLALSSFLHARRKTSHACVSYVHLIGIYLTGMCLIGVYPISVYITGEHVTGVHPMGVYLMGVHVMSAHRPP